MVEVGAGNGMNFGHYPDSVQAVLAVEPEPYLRRLAENAARRAPSTITVCAGVAEELPLASGSCDAAVASLVLCSVDDPAQALSELRRVLKPGGELRFFEHVRAPAARRARIQALLDGSRVWPLVAGGCRCWRDTISALASAGFEVERVRAVELGPAWAPTNPMLLGSARAPVPDPPR